MDLDIVICGFDPSNLVHIQKDDAAGFTGFDGQSLKVFSFGFKSRHHLTEPFTNGFEVIATNPVSGALERFEKSGAVNRFQQVIERAHLESPQSVFIIRGDENDLRHSFYANGLNDPESVHFGHLNVEKDQVGDFSLDDRHSLPPIAAFADDFDIQRLFEPHTDSFARQRFVINNQGSYLFHVVTPWLQLQSPIQYGMETRRLRSNRLPRRCVRRSGSRNHTNDRAWSACSKGPPLRSAFRARRLNPGRCRALRGASPHLDARRESR